MKTKTPTIKIKRNAQASREKLLKAAIEVFSRVGPEAATIDEICSKAGLNKRLAYHYFSGKQSLYKEALAAVYDQFFQLEVDLSSMLLPAEQLLETLVRNYYDFLKDHPDFIRLISFENLNEGRVAKELMLEGQKAPVITALRLALEKGRDEKRFNSDIDVNELLTSIFALCFFYFSNHYTMDQFLGRKGITRTSLDARIKHVVSLLLHGITRGANLKSGKDLQ